MVAVLIGVVIFATRLVVLIHPFVLTAILNAIVCKPVDMILVTYATMKTPQRLKNFGSRHPDLGFQSSNVRLSLKGTFSPDKGATRMGTPLSLVVESHTPFHNAF